MRTRCVEWITPNTPNTTANAACVSVRGAHGGGAAARLDRLDRRAGSLRCGGACAPHARFSHTDDPNSGLFRFLENTFEAVCGISACGYGNSPGRAATRRRHGPPTDAAAETRQGTRRAHGIIIILVCVEQGLAPFPWARAALRHGNSAARVGSRREAAVTRFDGAARGAASTGASNGPGVWTT